VCVFVCVCGVCVCVCGVCVCVCVCGVCVCVCVCVVCVCVFIILRCVNESLRQWPLECRFHRTLFVLRHGKTRQISWFFGQI